MIAVPRSRPLDAELAVRACVGRQVGLPVRGIDEADAGEHEHHDHRDLDPHHDVVRRRRFLDADVQHRAERQHDQHCGQVDDRAGRHQETVRALVERRTRQRLRQMNAPIAEQVGDVTRPPDRNRGRRHQIFERKIPADDPGERLAERAVRVRVRAARHGNHRSELRVADRGERGAEGSDEQRQRQGRSRVIRRDRAGQDENAGADRRAQADCRQRAGAQHPVQRRGAIQLGNDGFDGADGEQTAH